MESPRTCPDAALLAAFIDGTLADFERTAVVSHLIECHDCRAVVLTVAEFREVQALDELWHTGSMPVPPPLVESGMIRWTREKTRAPALAVAAVATLAAIGSPLYFVLPSWSARHAISTLTEVAEEQRPFEARLSDTDDYAPPPSLHDSANAAPAARIQLVSAASRVREIHGEDYGAPSRRAVGVAALLSGELDEAIATLEIATSADPHGTKIANDLAVAYYERSQRGNRPDDLPAALSAVERVLQSDPSHIQALFNRALIITAFGLRDEAETAWRAYIARDPDSPWAAEARRRLQHAAPVSNRPDWTKLRDALESGPTASDAEAAVRDQASAARDYIENQLLSRWVEAADGGDRSAQAAVLARIEVLGDAFARLSADRLYADFVASVADAHHGPGTAQVIAAHREFLAGMALMSSQRFPEAASVLERAHRALVAVGSPFSVRAQIELAATHYYALRYEEAARMLAEVKRAARERHHVILLTRAAWLQGMAAYGLHDFAAARIAYEEMLASAVTAGDIDQWVMANVLLANLHETLGDGMRAWQHRVDAAGRLGEVFTGFTRYAFLVSASGDAVGGEQHGAALLFQALLLDTETEVAPSVEVQVRAQRARSLFRLSRLADARDEIAKARQRLSALSDSDNRSRVEADVLAVEVEVWLDDDSPRASAAAHRLLTLPIVQRDQLRRARAHLQISDVLARDGDLDGAERAVEDGFAALEAFHASPSAEFAVRASDPVWRLYGNATRISLLRGDVARAFAYTERGRMRTPQERRAWHESIRTLEQVQRSLPRDTALTILTQLDQHLQIWVVRSDDVATHTIPMSASRAAALVSTQLQEMVRGASAPQASAELFDLILRPVVASIGNAADIVVVADAPYNRIAFAGLWDRTRDRYLVEDRRVVLAPSATAYASAVQRAEPGAAAPSLRRASIVGAPSGQSGAAAGSLAQSLSSVYAAGHVTRNDAATAAHLAEEVADGDIVHVSARVVANDEFPALSHVEMADAPGHRYSGAVYARAVGQSQPVRAQLIALESGAGTPVTSRSEGTFGFARALLAAGVSNVVSPVTDVEAKSVEQTWVDFHTHYAAGIAAAESLRRAQLAALSASNRRPGPWAALTVFGSTQ